MARTLLDGRYELLRNVASGGMGTVYEALHTGTGQRVAIKVVTSWDGDESETVVRFQREAKAAGSIETPHIVRVLDAGKDRFSGIPFIAMEFLEGCDLNRVVSEMGALDTQLALRIALQTCAGLDKAHAAGIVHRDIKPANLFLARDAGAVTVKLLDFGIAKLPQRLLSGLERRAVTTTGKLLGSPQFMSPEQAKGLRTLDHRTDIWSVGAVLYTMLAGFPPFEEFETVGQIIVAICSAPPSDLKRVAPDVPDDVAAIVHRALRMNPAERYGTARDMYEAIFELLPAGARIPEQELFGRARSLAAPAVPQIAAASEQVTWVGERTPLDVLQHWHAAPVSPTQAMTPRAPEAPVSQTLRSGASPAATGGAGVPRRTRLAVLGAVTAGAAALVGGLWWSKRAPESELMQTREGARAAVQESSRPRAPEILLAMPPLPKAGELTTPATPRPHTSDASAGARGTPRVARLRPARRSPAVAPEGSSAAVSAASSSPQPEAAPSPVSEAPSAAAGAASFSTLDKNFE